MARATDCDDLNPYEVLGVDRLATFEEIKKAYRTLVKTVHPDTGNKNAAGAERFHQVQWAFDLLANPKDREAYDRTGRVGDREMDLRDKVIHSVSSLFESVIDQEENVDSVDVIKKMIDTIRAAVPLIQKEKANTQRKAKKIKKMLKRLRRKKNRDTEGKPDIFRHILERRLEMLDRTVTANTEALEINSAMQDFLADYEYDTAPGFEDLRLSAPTSSVARRRAPGVWLGRDMPEDDD